MTARLAAHRKSWKEIEKKKKKKPSHLKNITIWRDFAWTQVTITSSALQAMKAGECGVTMDIQGNDPSKDEIALLFKKTEKHIEPLRNVLI